MSGAHAVYERLAGAVALGEATASERETFDAHAVACDACRGDVAAARHVGGAILAARDGETWRPSLERTVEVRIRDARVRRSTWATGALGWAVAASLVLNVAFASGFTSRLAGTFRETRESQTRVAASRRIVAVRQPLALHVAPVLARPAAVTVRRGARVVPARSRPQFGTAQRSVAAHAAAAREPDATAALPDVLAGLDVERPDGGARTVAVEPRNSTFPER